MKLLIIFSQLIREGNGPQQLSLAPASVPQAKLFSCKLQTASIPGIPSKEQNRYPVMRGDEILGDRLSLHEALKLAKGGEA
jgi:hypothetical protein